MKTIDIIKCLKANKNITDYEIKTSVKDSRELFYVLSHLEINRAVNVVTQGITVYVDTKKGKGDSLVLITAADNQKTLAKKINAAIKKAKTAVNVYYPLPEKTKNITEKPIKTEDLNMVASKIAEAVLKADVYEEGWINSTEIFVTKSKNEFISSKGIKHIAYQFNIAIEVIPTWSNKKEEFELYKYYEANTIDYKKITEEVNEILVNAKYRSEAKTIKQVKLPKDIKVLVKNDMLEKIVDNLSGDLSYRNVYYHQSHYDIKSLVSNNKFSLTMKGNVKGCSNSKEFDGNGIVLTSKTIIKDGKVKDLFGDARFGYYLKQKDISGNLPINVINAKGIDYAKEKHLIIENFSSPQLEENSGYWGGEVRLARYYDGKKYIPLTGFSISGNIYEDLKNVEFSKETCTMSSYAGPKYMIFKGLNIN